MKVLVTAFKPFNKMENNYSSEVLNYLNNVDKVIIDVLYDTSYIELSSKCNLNEYDLIIAMGEARMREELTLEIIAKNISSCSICDNGGIYKKDEEIIKEAPIEIHTEVDLANLNEFVKFSYDAGRFVCNNLYYHLLYNYPKKSLFIHVPNCNNDINLYIKNAKKIEEIIKKIKGE